MRHAAIALTLLALCAAGCKKGEEAPAPAPGPKQMTEAEPNDQAGNAIGLGEPTVVAASLGADPAKPDQDLYRIEALGPGKSARFEVSGIPGVDVALELLDRDGNSIAAFNSEAEGGGEKILNLEPKVPYLVRVYAAKKGSGGAYQATLTIDAAAAGAESEPNGRAVDATPLALGTPAQGLVGDRADEDWYRIEVPIPGGAEPAAPGGAAPPAQPAQPAAPAAPPPPAGAEGGAAAAATPAPAGPPPATVRLDITGVPGVRLQVEVANEAQAVFYTGKVKEDGEGFQVRNLALRPGESNYFVIVKSAWTGTGKEAKRGYNAEAPYTLTVTVEDAAANAELEPNDEAAKATPFAADGFKQGFFTPKGDADYFLVKVDQPRLLKIDLSGVDRVDSQLSLVRLKEEGSGEELLLKANDGGVREGEILANIAASPEKDVLLKVEAAPRQIAGKWVRDQENATDPYKLTITSRLDEGMDEREPNNTAELATPLPLKKMVRGLIHPKKDTDLYLVDLSASPVKVPLKATVTGILKVDVSLALHRVGDDGKLELVSKSEKGKGDAPETIRYTVEPARYVLEVRDTKNWQSNYLDAYQLTVEQEQ